MVDEAKNQANTSKLEELKQQAQELKNKIRTDYLAKKEASMNEWKESEESGVNMLQMAIIRKEHIETTKDCDKILDELFTGQMEHGLHYKKNKGIVDDFYKKVKDKIQELSTDEDWIKLRKWRRNYLRMKKDKTLKKNITDNDRTRRQLVDEVLKSKIDGEPTEALKRLDLSVDDAVKIIKNDNIDDVINEIGLRKFGDSWWNIPDIGISPYQLSIGQLFKNQGYFQYAIAKEQVNGWQIQVDLVKEQRAAILKRLKNVAQEMRQSDDVKALKELNRQIAELSKQTSK